MPVQARRTSISRLAIRTVASPHNARYEHAATLKGQLDSYPRSTPEGLTNHSYATSTLTIAIEIAKRRAPPKPPAPKADDSLFHLTEPARRRPLRFLDY